MDDWLEDVRSQLEEARHKLSVLRMVSATDKSETKTSKVEMKQIFTPPLVPMPHSSEIWSCLSLSLVDISSHRLLCSWVL